MQTRSEALNEIAKVITETIIKVLDNNLRSCLNCSRFNESREACNLYQARPPAKVIAKGCEKWDEINVPF